MPGVLSPRLRIAGGAGLYPVINRRGGRARIFGVIPGAGPAIALEAEDHGFSVRHNLIHIHFQVGDRAGGIIEVNPAVVDEIARGGVVAERDVVKFAAVIRVGGVELEGTATERRSIDHFHRAACGAIGSWIIEGHPASQRLNAADADGVRRDVRPRSIRSRPART